MSEKNRLRFEGEETAATSGQFGPKSKSRRRLAEAPADPSTPPPISSTPGTSPPVEDAPATSGQVGPKSGGKFRQESEQARPSERLRRDGEAPPGDEAAADGGAAPHDGPGPADKKAAREAGRFEKSGQRAEKTGAKLDKARDKLSKQKPPKKPGPVKTIGWAAKYQTWRYVHGKIREVEHENVGIEAAHKTELAGEKVLRGGTRFIKKRIRTRPARQVRKWEKKNIKAKADYAFRQMAQEHPELQKNALSRFWQKQRLKRQYRKQAKAAARQGARAAKKTAVTTEKIAAAAWAFVKRNPKVFLLGLAVFLVFVLLQSCMAAVLSIGNGLMGAVAGTSYLAEDADIDRAELAYTEWETDLQLEINNAERTHPGYDEYRYSVADISHNPYELMAFLTAVYDDFTFAGVQGALQQIFNEQYTLTFVEEIEVRYRTEERTDTWTDPETGEEYSDTYTVEVPYNYYILNISLTARSFSDVVQSRMNTEQRERFSVYMITKGNRQYLQSPFGETNWLPYVSSYYGYRVHPITGEKNYHKGADIALPEGTEILAGQDGTVTFAGNNGGYGLVVVLDNGEGLVSKYAHCSALLVSAGQTVQAGDPIARVGNTGDSTGPHLHLEIIKDGNYLNPLYFAVTNDYGQGPEYGDPGAAMSDGSYAVRWTKGKHAFFVVSHMDRPHPHVHIYYNSTTLDCTRKFRDFLGSARAVRRLSDRICLENGLSVIAKPKLKSKGKFKHYGEWQGDKPPTFQERIKAQIDICLADKPPSMDAFLQSMAAAGFEVKHRRGGGISFRAPGQERFTQFRAATLGEGYGQEDIQAAIEGRAAPRKGRAATHKVNLIVDIQAKMRAGKSPAYEKWATVYNLKQMAAALQYLQENDLMEYADLEHRASEATDRFHTPSGKIKSIEAAMNTNAELKAAIVDYAKTRPVFEGYKAARYSKKYLAEHEADIAVYRAARATMDSILNGAKLPKMDTLKADFQKLATDKKAAYRDYQAAKKDMQEVVTAKANIDHLLGLTDAQKNKEQER